MTDTTYAYAEAVHAFVRECAAARHPSSLELDDDALWGACSTEHVNEYSTLIRMRGEPLCAFQVVDGELIASRFVSPDQPVDAPATFDPTVPPPWHKSWS